MPEKPWNDMSADEKLDELHRLILACHAMLFGLEKSVERLKDAVASIPTDSL